MEARAICRFIPSSPRKMRLVIDTIRGVNAQAAMDLLAFQPKHAAKTAVRVLRSAVKNLMEKNDNVRLEAADMVVKEVYVDQGPTVKRISPAPMGRAYRIRKRSCHLTIVVASQSQKEE